MDDFGSLIRLAWPVIIGGVGIFISILTVFDLAERLIVNPAWLAFAAVAYAFSLTTLLAGYCVYRIIQTIRKERYANVTAHIHEINHGVRNLMTYMDEQSQNALNGKVEFEIYREKIRDKFNAVLDSIAHLFSRVTGTTCRACIKTVFEENSIPYLQRFARDSRSYNKCYELDERRKSELSDPLNLNTEFKRMTSIQGGGTAEWHYFCNDLRKKNNGFRSTSDAAYDPGGLPYRSTVCSAIGQAKTRDIQGPSTIVIGFLAIDSESRDVFSRRWDVELIYAFADALFHPLDRYLRVAINAAAKNLT